MKQKRISTIDKQRMILTLLQSKPMTNSEIQRKLTIQCVSQSTRKLFNCGFINREWIRVADNYGEYTNQYIFSFKDQNLKS